MLSYCKQRTKYKLLNFYFFMRCIIVLSPNQIKVADVRCFIRGVYFGKSLLFTYLPCFNLFITVSFLEQCLKYTTWESLESQKTDTCLSLTSHEYEPHARHKWSASLVRDYGTGRSIRYGSTLSHFLDLRNKYYNSSSSGGAILLLLLHSFESLMVISLAMQMNVHINR